MKVAIYGGAFNPLHNGHLAMIASLLNSEQFERVVVVPSGARPDKDLAIAAGERLQMVRLACNEAFSGDLRVVVDGRQCDGTIGYGTIDLVRVLRGELPTRELFFVIGAELLSDIPQWKEARALSELVTFLCMSRPGVTFGEVPEGFRIERLPAPAESGVLVSSSYIRDALKGKKSVAGLMPTIVSQYISLRKLYEGPTH